MNLRNYNKILIIRLSSLGDILLTTPLIRVLKKEYPHLTIDFLVFENFIDTVKYNPNLNKIHTITKNSDLNQFSESLKNENYDLVIDLHNNFRSNKIRRNLETDYVKFCKPNIKKFLLVNFKINLLKDRISIPERYADTIEIKLDGSGPEIFVDKTISRIDRDSNTVAVCPGSKHFTKMWPEEYFIELGNRLIDEGYEIALLGGKSDKEICERISSKVNGSKNLCTDDSLLQIAADLKNCEFAVCNDSGLMHTATAVNIPVVVFFGSTVQEFGFYPYKNSNLILENNSLFCRPCSHVGKNKCPKKHFKCMREITPELALEKIKDSFK